MIPISKFSRFKHTPVVTDVHGRERFIEWTPPLWGVVSEFVYVVDGRDIHRPDEIAKKVFGTVDLWWVLLDYNLISDPFSLEVGQKLRVPDPALVLRRTGATVLAKQPTTIEPPLATDYTVKVQYPFVPRRFVRPPSKAPAILEDPFLINFGFNVPSDLSGTLHFQLQISDGPNFETVLASRMTQTSTERWFIYDPSESGGAGGFKAYPRVGVNASVFEGQTVYYRLIDDDIRTDNGTTYTEFYFRWRTWISNIEGPWHTAPPLILT